MEPFKEQLNVKNAKIISDTIKKHFLSFDAKSFLSKAKKEIPALELKERISFIANALHALLPKDDKLCFALLVQCSKTLKGFKSLPLTEVVVLRNSDSLDLNLDTLFQLTSSCTSEFAIRPFLIAKEKKTLAFLMTRINSNCEHTRRLISEGTRPLLPWGMHIPSFKANPNLTWPLLEKLLFDDSQYVRTSVANHLNDHSKNHPDWVLSKLKKLSQSKDKNQLWILKRALRTMIKNGHPEALKLLGVQGNCVEVKKFTISTKKVVLGSHLRAEVLIKNISAETQKVIVDHELRLLRSNGKYSLKIFKGKNLVLKTKEQIELTLKLPLKEVTTRKYYKGTQYYSLKINGQSTNKHAFELY